MNDRLTAVEPFAEKRIPLEQTLPVSVSLKETATDITLQLLSIAGAKNDEQMPRFEDVMKDLRLQVWILKKDGTSLYQKEKPSWGILGGIVQELHVMYSFPKVSGGELAAVVLQMKGKLHVAPVLSREQKYGSSGGIED